MTRRVNRPRRMVAAFLVVWFLAVYTIMAVWAYDFFRNFSTEKKMLTHPAKGV